MATAWGVSFVVAFFGVYLEIRINEWNRDFYNALQSYDLASFLFQTKLFLGLVSLQVGFMAINHYLTEAIEAKLRFSMTVRLISKWLAVRLPSSAESFPDQRIAEDLDIYSTRLISFSVSVIAALVKAAAFLFILWQISPTLHIPMGSSEVTIPGSVALLSVLYFIVAGIVLNWAGVSLFRKENQKRAEEAILRGKLIDLAKIDSQLRHTSASRVRTTIAKITRISLDVAKTATLVSFFNGIISSFSILLPVIILAPSYFAHEIMLGVIIQTGGAFGNFQAAMSHVFGSYRQITRLVAAWSRIRAFEASLAFTHSN